MARKYVKIILDMSKEDWQTIYLMFSDIDEYNYIAQHIADELEKQTGWRP